MNTFHHTDLTVNDFKKNAGLRQVSKDCLNTFWGRFGMRQNATQTKIISDQAELNVYLNDPNICVKDLLPVSDAQIMLTYTYDEKISPIKPDLSLLIASHVTCHARITLFEKIMEIENVCGGNIETDLVRTSIFITENFLIKFFEPCQKISALRRHRLNCNGGKRRQT